MNTNIISEIIALHGYAKIGRACGVTPQAVRKWEAAGKLPLTEFSGETAHAEVLAKLSGGMTTPAKLRSLAKRTRPNESTNRAQ